MREDRKNVNFGDLYAIPSRNGVSKPSRVRGNGFKMINMGELFANDRIYDIEMELVPLNEKEQKNFLVLQNDLLFARQSIVAEGAGKCSIVMEVGDDITCFESHIIRVRLKEEKAHPLFYYYFFQSEVGKGYLSSIRQQGVQAGIRGSELSLLKLPYLQIETQRKIASILSAYDDLIENNLKRIKLLEEQAQLTYEEWFVRFKFPGHESAAFDEDSELPVGWEKIKLDNVLKASNGKSFKGDFFDGIGIPVYGSNGVIGQSDIFNNKEAIIVGRVGAYCGATRYCKGKFWATDNTIAITSIDERMPNILAFYIISLYDLRSMAGGAAQPLLTQRLINNLDVVVPLKQIASKFKTLINIIFDNVLNLQNQNQLLKEARDILLPRLMSGIIDVDNLEVGEQLGMVAERGERYNEI